MPQGGSRQLLRCAAADLVPHPLTACAALYGWAEAIDALLEDASVVSSTAAGHQPQLLRDALIADSQGHHRFEAEAGAAPGAVAQQWVIASSISSCIPPRPLPAAVVVLPKVH